MVKNMTPKEGNTKRQSKKLEVPSKTKPQRGRKKNTLVFNEEKRKEFLGGFHKRKVLRQKKAKEELQQQLKIEKKKIKENAKHQYEKMLSYRPVPELDVFNEQEFELEGRKVSVLELNIETMPKQSENEDVETPEETTEQSKTGVVAKKGKDIVTKKTIRKDVKVATLKYIKNSKAFKLKQSLDRNKNKKDARRTLAHKELKSKGRKKNKSHKSKKKNEKRA